jgi:hypothetical protein
MSHLDSDRRRSGQTGPADLDLPGPDSTTEERALAAILTSGLAGLRHPRPGFQEGLEARLIARMSQPAVPSRSWWRHRAPGRDQVRPRWGGLRRMPRRSLLGLAAGAAVALVAASLMSPIGGAPEASASNILDLSAAYAKDPVLAGVNNFHLVARSSGPDRPDGVGGVTVEQWFVAPDRMRTETRYTTLDGKTVVSGMLMSSSGMKRYETAGTEPKLTFGIFVAPIGFKGEMGPPPSGGASPEGAGPRTVASGGQQAIGVAAKPVPPPDGQHDVLYVAVRKPDGTGSVTASEDGKAEVFEIGPGCPEPKRSGDEVIAGRPTFKVERDMSACLPASFPARVPTRTISWVDKSTYLPLKLEGYERNGTLVDRYEVQSIEYDAAISEKVFTDLPAGTTVHDAPTYVQAQPPGGDQPVPVPSAPNAAPRP